ncbi:hypothetical protein JCM8547_003818 [Rhodosporidiobolus lusitaniae]
MPDVRLNLSHPPFFLFNRDVAQSSASEVDPTDLAFDLPPVSSNLTRRAETLSCTSGFSLSPDKLTCICRAPKYTSADGTRCSTSCTSGTYILPGEDRQCAPCPAPFSKCSSLDVPTGCMDGWFLLGNECKQTCPLGTWADSSPGKNRCRTCLDKDASGCENAGKTATGCMTKFLHNGACVDAAKVPDGFFPDATTHTAKECDQYVRTCIGNGVGKATSCGRNKKNDQLLLTPKGTCSLHCPSRYYADKRIAGCVPCDTTSLTCDVLGAKTCAKDSAGKQLFLTPTRKCILPEVGQAGYWPDKSTNALKACDDGTTSCVGNGPGTAFTCGKRGDGTPLYWTPSTRSEPQAARNRRRADQVVIAGDCVEASGCPAGTWADSAASTCTACDDDEEVCSKGGQGSAVVCKRGLYISTSKDCLTADECKASGAFYPDDDTRSCSTCDPFEAACTDNGLGFATACATNDNGDQLYLFDGNCVASTDCPAAYFPDTETKACTPCAKGALVCDSATKATLCGVDSDSNARLYLNIDGMCVIKNGCDSSTWADPATRKCESCKLIDEDAKSCTTPMLLVCTNKFFEASSSSCVDKCQDGFFANPDTHVCQVCSAVDAKTCSAENAATSCKTKLLWNGQCVDQCPAGPTLERDGVCVSCSSLFDDAATCEEGKATSWRV